MIEFQTPPRLFSKRFISIGIVIIVVTGILLYISGSFQEPAVAPQIEDIMDSIETVKPTDV